MKYHWKGKLLLIIHNFSQNPCELVITEKEAGTRKLIDLINNIESTASEKNPHTIILDPFGYRWFRSERQQ
jgi:maltose alpha-D-glucosyltransferase/alpha-amylase